MFQTNQTFNEYLIRKKKSIKNTVFFLQITQSQRRILIDIYFWVLRNPKSECALSRYLLIFVISSRAKKSHLDQMIMMKFKSYRDIRMPNKIVD